MKKRDGWCGETHIQKSIYFLQEGLGVPLGLEFVLYKHGPFSFDLRQLLAEMRASLLVEVRLRDPYGPSLEPSLSAHTLRERFPKTEALYSAQLDFVADKLGAKGVVDLERIGTALYVTRERYEASAEERASYIVELKPHITHDRALDAVKEVDRLLAESDESLEVAAV